MAKRLEDVISTAEHRYYKGFTPAQTPIGVHATGLAKATFRVAYRLGYMAGVRAERKRMMAVVRRIDDALEKL